MTEYKKEDKTPCKYCLERINKHAKVCHYCGRHQNRYIQYFDRIGVLISIGLLLLSFSQFNEARKEHIKAQEALQHAQRAEKKIEDSGKAIAKILLALSNLDETAGSLSVTKFFPSLMRNEAEALLSAINVTNEERREIYKVYHLIQEWLQLDLKQDINKQPSQELTKLENQIKQLTEK
jgi:hypothetical protein